MNTALKARLTHTVDMKPLVIVDGIPGGDDAVLTPQQLRALAAALLKLAGDAEARKLVHRGKPMPTERRVYPLSS